MPAFAMTRTHDMCLPCSARPQSQDRVRTGSALGQHGVRIDSAHGPHRVSLGSAQGQHRVSTGSAQGQHRVSIEAACLQREAVVFGYDGKHRRPDRANESSQGSAAGPKQGCRLLLLCHQQEHDGSGAADARESKDGARRHKPRCWCC